MSTTRSVATENKADSLLSKAMNFTKYVFKHPALVIFSATSLSIVFREALKSASSATDFSEYPVEVDTLSYEIYFQQSTYSNKYAGTPKLDISPVQRLHPHYTDLPFDPIFNKSYLLKHHVFLEENGYFARGDHRAPEPLNFIIPPKCHSDSQKPHFDVTRHQEDSDCSGFVSLTDKLGIAHFFGGGNAEYYVYIAEMKRGLRKEAGFEEYPVESEHSAIGPVKIVGYRKCREYPNFFSCGNVFTRKSLSPELHDKVTKSQLLPYERLMK